MKKVFLVFALVAAYGVSMAMSGPSVVTVNDDKATIVANVDDNTVTAPEGEKEKAKTKEATAAKSDGCATAKSEGCATAKTAAKSEGCATAKTAAKGEGCATAKTADCGDKSKTATAENK